MFDIYIEQTNATPRPNDVLIQPKNPSLVWKAIVNSDVMRQIGKTHTKGTPKKRINETAG